MAAVMTPFGVLSFPNIFTARPVVEGGEPRYSINLIFDKKAQATDEYKALQEAVRLCAKEKWGDKIPSKLRNPFQDAGEKDYQGYGEGKTFINAWSKQAPGIVGPSREDILDPSDVFAGQLVRATVKPFAYDNTGNKGVSFGLENIQIGKFDMPRLDGRTAADKAFDDVEVENDNDDDDMYKIF